MNPTTRDRAAWAVLVSVSGVALAAVIYIVSADVVWAIIPLLLTVAAVRRLLRRDANKP
jgi:hypothetical protein